MIFRSCLLRLQPHPSATYQTSLRDCPMCRERFSRDCLRQLRVDALPFPGGNIINNPCYGEGSGRSHKSGAESSKFNVGGWMRKDRGSGSHQCVRSFLWVTTRQAHVFQREIGSHGAATSHLAGMCVSHGSGDACADTFQRGLLGACTISTQPS